MNLRSRAAFLIVFLMLAAALSAYAQEEEPPAGVTIHVVQRGETLYRIAVRYGLTVDELVLLNSLPNPNSIQVGQRLLVPAEPQVIGETHIVQPGETLRTIAELYGVTIAQLAAWNSIGNIDAIYAGQALIVSDSAAEAPASSPTAPPVEPTEAVLDPTATPPAATLVADSTQPEEPAERAEYSTLIHTVQRGETLFRIAQQYGVTVNAILRGNQLGDPDTIYAGQQLAIPGVEAPQLVADLPQPLTSLEMLPLLLVEGQTGRLRMTTSAPVTLTGIFLDRPLNIAEEEGGTRETALIGVPVGTAAGVYPLNLRVESAAEVFDLSINIQVLNGGYGREVLRLVAGRDDLLDPAVEDAEMSILRSVMSPFSPERYFDGPMGLPAAASMSSPFGNIRSYNGGAFERIHAGVDFAGVPGTPILAPAPGRVVLADDLNVRGTATIIDHGWGVFSGYWHQSARYVSIGDFVQTGQVIGAIGSSGRVTGPHLHWELWVNGVAVDPMQWVSVNFAS